MSKSSVFSFLFTVVLIAVNVSANSDSYLVSCSDSLPAQECPDSFFYTTSRSGSEGLKDSWTPIEDKSEIEVFYNQLGVSIPAQCWEVNNPHCHETAHQITNSTESDKMQVAFITEGSELVHYVMPDGSTEYYPLKNRGAAIGNVIIMMTSFYGFIAFGTIATAVTGDYSYLIFLLGAPLSCGAMCLLEIWNKPKRTYF